MKKKENQLDPKFIDELAKKYTNPEDIFGKDGLFKQIQKALLERMLAGELTTELGYEKNSSEGNNTGNSRNGYSEKTLKGEHGELTISVPRDRNGEFEPKIIAKNQTRLNGLDEKIISLYARGMTTRDIQEQLKDLYDVEISATMISNVTNEVIDEVKTWQSRPLDKIYPIVFLDALVIKIQEDKRVINKAFYLALGINCDGEKELLGIWVSQNEGAKFWLSVLTEIKNRGVEDIFVACVDGLTGFPEAIETVYPKTQTQLCIVHMIRNSLRYVGWKNRKIVAADLKTIYGAKTTEEAELALDAFAKKWDKEFPSISKSWRDKWHNLTPFFAFPADIRKAIYTTNAIESVNRSLRKISKNRGVFPHQEALLKLYYLTLDRIMKKWTMPIHNWSAALNRFAIEFGDRMPTLD